MTNRDEAPGDVYRLTGLYRAAVVLAVVACAFTLVVVMLLVSDLLVARGASPLAVPELDQLRASLKAAPGNAEVRDKIRALDQAVRLVYFQSLASRRTGLYLLLGGVAVALASLRTVAVLRRRLPDPRTYGPPGEARDAESAARWTIAGTMVAMMFIAVLWVGRGGMGVGGVAGAPPSSAAGEPVWPAFRGPAGDGVARTPAHPPVFWDVATGSNVAWRAAIPLPGLSSPVVWGNRVLLTGASEARREVYCFELAGGALLWTADVGALAPTSKPAPEIFQETGYAAPTPVTDGQFLYAVFANGDVIALDHCAGKRWSVDLGLPVNRYGHSASLACHDGRVLIQFDQDRDKQATSKLIALDAATGRTAWTTARPVADSWPSPLLIATQAGRQWVTVANDRIAAYDPVTGRELWWVTCAGTDVAPTPIFAGGLVLAPVTGDKLYAIRPDGAGDVTATHVAWTSEDGVSDVPSPLSDGERVYVVNSGGHLVCLEVATGAKAWDRQLDGEFYGSPALAGGLIYLVARNGDVFIFKPGARHEAVGTVALGEPSDGSPVFAGDRLFIRGIKTLFCLGGRKP
jgi:outer membrane protein assembly factor BamB